MTTFPGPARLGRGVVVPVGVEPPEPWRRSPRLRLDEGSVEGAGELVDRLHRAWVTREPVVVEWDLPDDALAAAEVDSRPVWSLPADFLFPRERLRFLVFSNNYDARRGAPRWWWATKASRLVGAEPGGDADVVLPDGSIAWIDGGPREAGLGSAVIHGETISLGRLDPVPAGRPPPGAELDDAQLAAVAHRAGPARVIAPAGSGKTRTLAARLRHLLDGIGVEPELVVAVAYNAR
ncbi:MAG TPA: ATP-dependent helicase, partial [Actinobacteria bacterium]|nr:ATP-dependent helicase [Actinomycetota bacterium]